MSIPRLRDFKKLALEPHGYANVREWKQNIRAVWMGFLSSQKKNQMK